MRPQPSKRDSILAYLFVAAIFVSVFGVASWFLMQPYLEMHDTRPNSAAQLQRVWCENNREECRRYRNSYFNRHRFYGRY